MMLTSKTLKYYDWFEVQKFLSAAMGFEDKYFRDYHKIVGGDYKDFWHVWLDMVNGDVYNGCWSSVYLDNNKDWVEGAIEKNGDWTLPLEKALDDLRQYVGEDTIVIEYSW